MEKIIVRKKILIYAHCLYARQIGANPSQGCAYFDVVSSCLRALFICFGNTPCQLRAKKPQVLFNDFKMTNYGHFCRF